MQSQAFEPPASIELGRVGLIRNVGSVREAAECLLSIDWPEVGRDGTAAKEILAAAQVLLAAREGRATAAEARQAFETAASHAGILVTGWTAPISTDAPRKPVQWRKRRR